MPTGMGDAGLPQILPEPHIDRALGITASVEPGEIVGIKGTRFVHCPAVLPAPLRKGRINKVCKRGGG
jgi:hypothetical protein